jgi:two-component SAPR family response regulator
LRLFLLTDAIDGVHRHTVAAGRFITDNFKLFARGGLLQQVPETWLDDVKLNFEESLAQVILPELQKIYDDGDHKKALELSRIILSIDPFNDRALKYKLKALRRIKGIDYSKKVYDEFVAEYHKSLGGEYPVNFDKICK